MPKKVKMGLVGLGRISDLHFPAYHQYDQAEIAMVCDANEQVPKQEASS